MPGEYSGEIGRGLGMLDLTPGRKEAGEYEARSAAIREAHARRERGDATE